MVSEINEIQDEIIEEFSILEGDYESTIFYIMDLGKKLRALDDNFRIDKYII